MSHQQKNVTFYLFQDLRYQQNNNYEHGPKVPRFDTMEEAVEAFRRCPEDWTTALGIQTSQGREIDLVQKREGEPVLTCDYMRIPSLLSDPDVQEAAKRLCSELKIQWASDYRVFGFNPVLMPVVPDLDYISDRFFSGKHLVPDDPKHVLSAAQEAYVEGRGWLPLYDVYDLVRSYGYNDPHVPKVRTIHAAYSDETGKVHHGDMTPYQFAMLREHTLIRDQDKETIHALSRHVEDYIYRTNPEGYKDLFGSEAPPEPVESKLQEQSRKIENQKHVAELIATRNLTSVVEQVVLAAETGIARPELRSETRELLNRLLNIQGIGDQGLSLDLKVRSTAVLNDLYNGSTEKTVRPERSPSTREESR